MRNPSLTAAAAAAAAAYPRAKGLPLNNEVSHRLGKNGEWPLR